MEALGQAPPWRSYDISDARLIDTGPDSAALVYLGSAYGDGAEPAFVGLMTSVYVRRGDQWKLAVLPANPAAFRKRLPRPFSRKKYRSPIRVWDTREPTRAAIPTSNRRSPHRRAHPHFAEARTVLEVAPWGGHSLNDDHPAAPVRSLAFGPDHQGLITYLILDDQRRVDILDVLWLS